MIDCAVLNPSRGSWRNPIFMSNLKPHFAASLVTLVATSICALGLVLCLPFSTAVHADTLPISLHGTEAPAVDLLYQGETIDRDEAVDLKTHGVDLSQLDPVTSDVWTPQALPAALADGQPDSRGIVWNFPSDGAVVTFDSPMAAASEMSRARVLSGDGLMGQPFQLMMSLGAHAALTRAALLRKLGYPIQTGRHYKKLTVKFGTEEARKSFIDSLVTSTHTAEARWVTSHPKDSLELTIQDVVLEPAQIDMPMYHWAVIPPTALKGRRAVRALIVPLVLLDVPESINLYSWEVGAILDNNIIFTHPYAGSFQETAYEDARWLARRLMPLTRADFTEIVALGRYPEDVAALLTEKLIARRNHLIQLFDLGNELPVFERAIPYDVHLNHGAVQGGKLTQANYEGYVMRFSWGDPESPLRTSEVARFLLIEGISDAMSGLAKKANTYLSLHSIDNVGTEHQATVLRDLYQHLHDHPNEPFAKPVGAWGGPIGGFGVSANRNVVTGTYYGSDSKVQLVDNIAVQASIGYFMGYDGLPVITPAVAGNVVVQRNYLHIRPISDMRSALSTDWTNLFVPKFMAHLTSMLDASPETLKDQTKIDTELKDFLESLKPGEMLVIVDSAMAGIKGQINVPIPLLLNPSLTEFNPSLGLSIGAQPSMLRRTTFTRTADGVQVYLQNAQMLEFNTAFDFNWWINVLKLTHINKLGQGRTKAFLLDKEPDSPGERKNLLISLRSLLGSNNSELLEDNFKNYELNHRMITEINSAKLLWWKWSGIEEKHKVTIAPPEHPDKMRTLYSDRVVHTRGVDGYAFFADVVSALSKDTVKISTASSTYNPSNSFLGYGQWVSANTEAEITPGSDFAPVTVIEHHFGGWSLSKTGLFKILDELELKARQLNLDRPLIRRDVFETTESLQMYEVLSTLIIYQSAMKRIADTIFLPDNVDDVVNGLISMEGPKVMDSWCGEPARWLGDRLWGMDSYNEKDAQGKKHKFTCLKPWMMKLLAFRHSFRGGAYPNDSEGRVQWVNNVVGVLEKYVDLPKLLTWLGHDNYFFQIKVSGFRTHDENGDSKYTSDSVGSFNSKQGAGPFRDFASKYGILSSELSATYLSEGF
jgi:hypothetical protein